MERVTPKSVALLAAGWLAFSVPAHADERIWSASGDATNAVVTDCGHCGDDVGILIACKAPGATVDITVPWAAAPAVENNAPAPVTIVVGESSFNYAATTRNIAAIGFAPEFQVGAGDPLLLALRAGDKARVRFLGADTTIALNGAWRALDDFGARCGWRRRRRTMAPNGRSR